MSENTERGRRQPNPAIENMDTYQRDCKRRCANMPNSRSSASSATIRGSVSPTASTLSGVPEDSGDEHDMINTARVAMKYAVLLMPARYYLSSSMSIQLRTSMLKALSMLY